MNRLLSLFALFVLALIGIALLFGAVYVAIYPDGTSSAVVTIVFSLIFLLPAGIGFRQLLDKEFERKAALHDCPVCGKSGSLKFELSRLLGSAYRCTNCKAKLIQSSWKYKLVGTDMMESAAWKEYKGHTLTAKEWTAISKGGISDAKQHALDAAKAILDASRAIQEAGSKPLTCPKCGSTNVFVSKKGFDAGSACCGAVLLGPLGLLCGAADQNVVQKTCLNCNNVWR